MEIATYTALERLAASVGDDTTARLAASIRADEEPMLARLLRDIPKLVEAVVGAELRGEPSYRVADTGAADAVREAATSAKSTARQARKVPGVARAEGQVKGAVASEQDLAIGRYDALTADEIIGRLTGLSQVDLAKVAAYERKHEKRSTVLGRIDSLHGNEPWPGYDKLTADEVRAVLANADDDRIGEVRAYERGHKNRAGVLKATEREAATA